MALLRRLALMLTTLSVLLTQGMAFRIVAAEEYWEGYDAFDRGDYRAALRIYRRLAEAGDVQSQDDLGYMYYLGQGTAQNFTTAAKWFRRAADQGHAPAQLNLGVLYQQGHGLPKDSIEAHRWFSLSALLATTADSRDLSVGYRDAFARRMTSAELDKARHAACRWWREFKGRPNNPIHGLKDGHSAKLPGCEPESP